MAGSCRSVTFLEYLKRDADRLFDDTMSFNDIKDMPLLAYDGTIVRARELNIQYIEYNEDAKILCEKAWCPKTYVVLSQKYTDDFSQDMRQLFKIVKFDINTTTDILAHNANLRQSFNVINNNVDFWRWVKVNQKQIASVDKFKTIPLLDNNNALINCASLYISDIYQQEQIEVNRPVTIFSFQKTSCATAFLSQHIPLTVHRNKPPDVVNPCVKSVVINIRVSSL